MARLESGRSNDRTSQARALPTPGVDDASLTLGRRIGVLVVLAALGGAIILAAGGVGGGAGEQGAVIVPQPTASSLVATVTPAPTATPLPDPPAVAPVLVTPKRVLLTSRTTDLRVGVPRDEVTWGGLEVRIYRGTKKLASTRIARRDLTGNGRVVLRDVPLRRGGNRLAAVFANAGGEGPRSRAMDLTVDDQAPRFERLAPRPGTTLNAAAIEVKGTTEPGLEVLVRNLATGSRAVLPTTATGRFSTQVGLARGRNTLSISTRDAAGNSREERRLVIRGDGRTSVDLKLSRDTLRARKLPRTITARATVLDADGQPVKDARVVFTAAIDGMQAFTYEGRTGADGVAAWSGLRVTDRAVAGKGLVSVDVTMPTGATLKKTVELLVR